MNNAKDPFIEVRAGAEVYKEGDAGSDMYIIESGQIDIVRQSGSEEVIDSLGPGDFFGEMAMLEDQPRGVTAIAKITSRILRIERAAFADVLRQNVEIAVRIMRKMSARQRRTEQRMHDALTELMKAKAGSAAPRSPGPAAPAPRPATAREPAPAAPAARSEPAAAPLAAQHLALRLPSGQILPLDATRSEYLVGRPDPVTGTEPEINLGPFDANRTLSRRHAKILREGALYFVRDEGGANGTFVNGERVNTGASVALKPGDKLRFGSVEVELGVA
jgi:hypothetical protein